MMMMMMMMMSIRKKESHMNINYKAQVFGKWKCLEKDVGEGNN